MTERAWSAMALTVGVALATPAPAQPRALTRAAGMAVMLDGVTPAGVATSGVGILVASQSAGEQGELQRLTLWTAQHVLHPDRSNLQDVAVLTARFEWDPETAHPVTLVAESPSREDLAILAVTIPFSGASYACGDLASRFDLDDSLELVVIGRGWEKTTLNRFQSSDETRITFETPSARQGWSGSPVFTRDGLKLLGMLQSDSGGIATAAKAVAMKVGDASACPFGAEGLLAQNSLGGIHLGVSYPGVNEGHKVGPHLGATVETALTTRVAKLDVGLAVGGGIDLGYADDGTGHKFLGRVMLTVGLALDVSSQLMVRLLYTPQFYVFVNSVGGTLIASDNELTGRAFRVLIGRWYAKRAYFSLVFDYLHRVRKDPIFVFGVSSGGNFGT